MFFVPWNIPRDKSHFNTNLTLILSPIRDYIDSDILWNVFVYEIPRKINVFIEFFCWLFEISTKHIFILHD